MGDENGFLSFMITMHAVSVMLYIGYCMLEASTKKNSF